MRSQKGGDLPTLIPRPFFKFGRGFIHIPCLFGKMWVWLHLQTTPPFSSLGVASFTYHAFLVSYGRGFLNRPRPRGFTFLLPCPFIKLGHVSIYLLTTPIFQVWLGVAYPTHWLYLISDHTPISRLGVSSLICQPRPFFSEEKRWKNNNKEIIERLLHMVFSYSIFPTFKKPKMPYHYFYYERKIITA